MPRRKQRKPNYYAPLIAEWFQQGLSGAQIDAELGKLREREQMKVKLEAETEAEKVWVAGIKAKNAEKRRRLDVRGFSKFPLLPIELQVMIWKEAIKDEPIRIGEQYSYISYGEISVNIYPWVNEYPQTRCGPVFLATCRPSRLLALQAWIRELDYLLDDHSRRRLSYQEEGDWVFEKWRILLVEYVKAMGESRAPVRPCNEYWSWRFKPAPRNPSGRSELRPRSREYDGTLRKGACAPDSWVLAHEDCCLDVKSYWTFVPWA